MPIDPMQNNLGAPNAPTSGGSLTAAAEKSGMGRDDFLQLLTAQIANQDPLEPLKNHEFVAQLAQFSALEQQVATNTTLGQMQLSQLSLANAQLTNMIGKEVEARGDTVSIAGGRPQSIGLMLPSDAATVNITITDATGKMVSTMQRTRLSAGHHELPWSGRDISGTLLEDGRYKVTVEATDSEGNSISVDPLTRGIVQGITFESGVAELIVGSARIVPADIISINNIQTAPSLAPAVPPGIDAEDASTNEPDTGAGSGSGSAGSSSGPRDAIAPESVQIVPEAIVPPGRDATLTLATPPPWRFPVSH
ncbi:MAG: flagellar hook capping FlgD N-terminal domain-containing protein [Nannocystaceae bacterium]